MVKHTDPSLVSAAKDTMITPYNRNHIGYGSKIATCHMVKYAGRWQRVYVMCYGNSGSAYLVKNGEILFIDSHTECIFEGVMPDNWATMLNV